MGADPAVAVAVLGGSGADPAAGSTLPFDDHRVLSDNGADPAAAV